MTERRSIADPTPSGEPDARYARRLGRRLVARPNTVQFGHLGLEILLSLAQARELREPLTWLRGPGRFRRSALFSLIAREVACNRPNLVTEQALNAWWRAADSRTELGDAMFALRQSWRHEVSRVLGRHSVDARRHPVLRDMLRARRAAIVDRERQVAAARSERGGRPYYRRRLMRTPIEVALPEALVEQTARASCALGLDEAAPIVTLHVREPGYKRGMEVQDKDEASRDDSYRNARVESYLPAIDWLVGQGYQVVRIGDPTMTPVRRAGVFDLARWPERTEALEIALLMRSAFLIGSESGPLVVSYLTNTPNLTLNATDPISSFPIRGDGVYLLKRVYDREARRWLPPEELLGDDHLLNLRNRQRYAYWPNTPGEILASVQEMEDVVVRGRPVSTRQRQWHAEVEAADRRMRPRSTYIRKWGADDGFLGDGRVAGALFERRA